MTNRFADVCNLRHYKLLKILTGSSAHTAEITIPLFANDQDIAQWAKQVDNYMNNNPFTTV